VSEVKSDSYYNQSFPRQAKRQQFQKHPLGTIRRMTHIEAIELMMRCRSPNLSDEARIAHHYEPKSSSTR